jgi:hypothetical protein
MCRLRATATISVRFRFRNLLVVEPVVLISPPIAKNKNDHKGRCYFWWESACTNRAENKQEFSELMQRLKEFKEKWLN